MAGVIQWKEQTMTASEGLVEEVGTWHHEEEEEGDQQHGEGEQDTPFHEEGSLLLWEGHEMVDNWHIVVRGACPFLHMWGLKVGVAALLGVAHNNQGVEACEDEGQPRHAQGCQGSVGDPEGVWISQRIPHVETCCAHSYYFLVVPQVEVDQQEQDAPVEENTLILTVPQAGVQDDPEPCAGMGLLGIPFQVEEDETCVYGHQDSVSGCHPRLHVSVVSSADRSEGHLHC